jgi:hypothetical protein
MADAGLIRRMVAAAAAACLLSVFTAPGAGADPADPPQVGPEHAVSNPIEGPVAGTPTDADMASHGSTHLVVWTDSRASVSSGYDIYGARVTPDGQVLDPGGIRIATGIGDQQEPSVAFGDGHYLVVWSDIRSAGPADVRGTRVTPAGTVLDPDGIPVSTARGDQREVDVAHGDGRFLVVWQDTRSGELDVYGARVDPSGAVLDATGIPISTAPGFQRAPAVASGGGSFMVVWNDGRNGSDAPDLFGARVDAAGTVLDPTGIPVAAGPEFSGPPEIASNGSHHLVVRTEFSNGLAVVGTRIAPDGSVVDPSPIVIAPATVDVAVTDPGVTTSGSTFLVAWQARAVEQFDALGARIAADGTNLDPSGFLVARDTGRSGRIDVTSDGSAAFAVWEDERLGPQQLYGTGISADGHATGPGTLVSRAANAQADSAIAFDGGHHLIAWSDNRVGTGGVYASLMRFDGERLGGPDIVISRGGAPSRVEAIFSGTHFVVAWVDGHRPHVAYVDPSGQLPSPPFALPYEFDDIVDLDIVANGIGTLLVWTMAGPGFSYARATRIYPGGPTDETPIDIENAAGVSLAADAFRFLIVWSGSVGGEPEVRGMRVNANDRKVLDPDGFVIASDTSTTETGTAWNGERYLVAWSAQDGGGSDVLAARVTAAAEVEDPVPIAVSTEPGNQREPVVAGDDGPFLVAWRETDDEGIDDLRGARVGDDGTVIDTPSFPIATSGDSEREIALSPSNGSLWGVSYTRFVPEPPFGADRVFFRSVSPK